MKTARVFGVFSALFLAAVIFVLPTACSDNVGLGSAVDTESPKLSITSPAANDVTSGTFTVSGTCSDDVAVVSIPVSIRKTSSDTTVDLGEADISKDGTSWSISVNAYDLNNADYCNGWQFTDGSYVVTAKAYDGSGRGSDEIQYDLHIRKGSRRQDR